MSPLIIFAMLSASIHAKITGKWFKVLVAPSSAVCLVGFPASNLVPSIHSSSLTYTPVLKICASFTDFHPCLRNDLAKQVYKRCSNTYHQVWNKNKEVPCRENFLDCLTQILYSHCLEDSMWLKLRTMLQTYMDDVITKHFSCIHPHSNYISSTKFHSELKT
ncbi:hypothetical protein HELRODRAFT_171869 [Helobdella robusta]|uniref:Uncharacterized protein n=1 Tax=Helobdella robusta TaxID=6412 RepID=T1F4S6_HELRO|nr:hypothetical protein HELRODRAFT_171869 [Helobdella robusta]ESO04868.1 hypothetical protein HELRODRAFT_171869 [Helobdella robusta]